MKWILYAVFGAVAFAATHVIAGWFLDSGRAAALTVGCMFAANAITATRRPLAQGASFASGAIVAMTLLLFRDGPGNIFPIVLAIGSVIILAFSVTGALLGIRLRQRA